MYYTTSSTTERKLVLKDVDAFPSGVQKRLGCIVLYASGSDGGGQDQIPTRNQGKVRHMVSQTQRPGKLNQPGTGPVALQSSGQDFLRMSPANQRLPHLRGRGPSHPVNRTRLDIG